MKKKKRKQKTIGTVRHRCCLSVHLVLTLIDENPSSGLPLQLLFVAVVVVPAPISEPEDDISIRHRFLFVPFVSCFFHCRSRLWINFSNSYPSSAGNGRAKLLRTSAANDPSPSASGQSISDTYRELLPETSGRREFFRFSIFLFK